MGLMIYDRKNGAFEFVLSSVEAYSTRASENIESSAATIAGQL
jgi:hypothetical protein